MYMHPPYAGFGYRLLAFLIDGFVVSFIALPVAGLVVGSDAMQLAGLSAGSGGDPQISDEAFATLMLVLFKFYGAYYFVTIAYGTLLEGLKGATLGKMALSLKVLGADESELSMLQALGRNVSKQFVSGFLFISFFFPLFTQRKQTLHDMIASTIVIGR